MPYATGSTPEVTTKDEYILGPDDIPFFTTTWAPANEEPKAYVLFVHGFSEHIARYHTFFRRLAASPSSLHITAFDQRGFGRTSHQPLTSSSPEVQTWVKEGRRVSLEVNAKRRTGGWAKVMPDIEWFVKRESERAKAAGGKKLFLHGFSMGGAEVLAFVTRPTAPPLKETVSLLSGVISGGPLIRQTTPASRIQLGVGSMVAGLGMGNTLRPAPLDPHQLSHNADSNQLAINDPFCEQVGSIRGIADMLNGGMTLDNAETGWNAWPEDLPVYIYHGGEDSICSPEAAKRFGENVRAKDKRVDIIPGMYHEVHNELEPTPAENAKAITEWIHARLGEGSSGSSSAKL